ncbi:sterol desaturase family protein [Colletotrichum limetticola]|uniref:Sterol desaturase family protein n=1 Tax=Colletotrichum limetticola TaxID=1209924 RepID=A0ABQ9PEL2_9PEZI|nr:sterol desaturase family protein [Colletotrichum limetticola]
MRRYVMAANVRLDDAAAAYLRRALPSNSAALSPDQTHLISQQQLTSSVTLNAMDILLSLPIVSYFLAPSITSWTTSLNLLFFYMTWTTLILSHGPLKIQLLGAVAIRLILWLIPSLAFLLFDTLLPSLSESIKTAGAAALPPTHGPTLLKTLALALFNLALSAALEGATSLAYASYFHEPLFRASSALPLPFQLLKHVAFLIVAREVLTYYIHTRILHSRGRRLTSTRVGKLHASYAHARAAPPFSLMLFADHPIPFLLHRIVPIFVPAVVLRPHLLTYFLFVGFCTIEETMAMSGYSVVPGIVMGGITRRTAIHYAGQGDGNFGAWGVLDWAHGTSEGQDVIDDMKAEAEKHRIKERSERAANNGVGFVQGGIQELKKGRGRKGKKSN